MTIYTETNPLIIDVCGDSTIAGWSDNGRYGGPVPGAEGDAGAFVAVPAPQGLQALLQAKYGPLVTVNNNGHSGTNCTNWQNGSLGVPTPWAQYVTTTPASIIVLCLGINDTIDELTAIYPTLVNEALAAGKMFVIQTSNVIDNQWAPPLAPKVTEEYQIAVANDLSVIDFNAATLGMGNSWYENFLSYGMAAGTMWVGVHPTQDGYTLMSAVEFGVLDKIVGKMLGYPTGKVSCESTPQGSVTNWKVSNGAYSAINVTGFDWYSFLG